MRDIPVDLITVDGEGHFVPAQIASVSCRVYWRPRGGATAIDVGSSCLASAIEAGATKSRLIAAGAFEIDDSLCGSFYSPDFFGTLNPRPSAAGSCFHP